MATIGLIAVIIIGLLALAYWLGITFLMFSGLGAHNTSDTIHYIVYTVLLLGISGLCFYHAFQHFHITIT